jgi:hypothetical protein
MEYIRGLWGVHKYGEFRIVLLWEDGGSLSSIKRNQQLYTEKRVEDLFDRGGRGEAEGKVMPKPPASGDFLEARDG